MQINFISSLGVDEIRTMHLKSKNVEIIMGSKTANIIKKLFESFLNKYQNGLERKMKGSEFVFESVDLLCYHLHRISLKRGGSYMHSPDWIKNKKSTINPKNKDNECFIYAVTIALNHEKIGNNPERISSLC